LFSGRVGIGCRQCLASEAMRGREKEDVVLLHPLLRLARRVIL